LQHINKQTKIDEFLFILSSTFRIKASDYTMRIVCGVSLQTLRWVWNKVEAQFVFTKNGPRNLLMALHFLRHYPTEALGAVYWGFQDCKYYSKIVWECIFIMYDCFPKPCFEDRVFTPAPTGLFENVYAVVDATECVIKPPRTTWNHQAVFYSNKKKIHGLKYQIICRSLDGIIVDGYGLFPCTVHDKKVLDSWQASSNISLNNELHAADKSYVGQRRCLVSLKKNQQFNLNDKHYNKVLGSVRCIVEQSIGRIKIFKCTRAKWRHELWKHEFAFMVCSVLANKHMEERPLRRARNKLLFI